MSNNSQGRWIAKDSQLSTSVQHLKEKLLPDVLLALQALAESQQPKTKQEEL